MPKQFRQSVSFVVQIACVASVFKKFRTRGKWGEQKMESGEWVTLSFPSSLQTQDLTEIRASDMTTEADNVNRVLLKKSKTPKTQTGDTKRPQIENGLLRGSQKRKVVTKTTTYALENASFAVLLMR